MIFFVVVSRSIILFLNSFAARRALCYFWTFLHWFSFLPSFLPFRSAIFYYFFSFRADCQPITTSSFFYWTNIEWFYLICIVAVNWCRSNKYYWQMIMKHWEEIRSLYFTWWEWVSLAAGQMLNHANLAHFFQYLLICKLSRSMPFVSNGNPKYTTERAKNRHHRRTV